MNRDEHTVVRIRRGNKARSPPLCADLSCLVLSCLSSVSISVCLSVLALPTLLSACLGLPCPPRLALLAHAGVFLILAVVLLPVPCLSGGSSVRSSLCSVHPPTGAIDFLLVRSFLADTRLCLCLCVSLCVCVCARVAVCRLVWIFSSVCSCSPRPPHCRFC